MMRSRIGSRSLAGLVAATAAGLAMWSAAPAAASCAQLIADPAPGYSGPMLRGISCTYHEYGDGPEEKWTVPAEVREAKFIVRGADDAVGGRGGYVEATLAVSPGETLTLLLGSKGNANLIKRGETLLIAAGGGNGLEPNYVVPGATEVQTQPPGQPNPPYPGNGEVSISWYEGWIDFPPREQCIVPQLHGKRPAAARRALRAADCSAGAVVRLPARPRLRGRVIHQSQRPGTVLSEGARVELVVGRRP